MNNLLHRKNGCWIAGGIPFARKLDALAHASKTNTYLRFYFHDHIWESFDRSILGKNSLQFLYKLRAEQLRDQYDYLILYYSGGADSHNILHTFLTNNIRLDEIRVKWPKQLKDGYGYVPNIIDTTANNHVSEWNYAIKPVLEKLHLSNPEIKINFIEYTENIDRQKIEVARIEKEVYRMNMLKAALSSFVQRLNKNIYTQFPFKKNEAHIFGTDKPILNVNGNSIEMVFVDHLIENTVFPADIENPNIEFFYWTPDFPLLPMEQSYQTAVYLAAHNLLNCIKLENVSPRSELLKNKKQELRQIQRKILYDHSWNNNFQAGKPRALLDDVYFWIYESREFDNLRENFSIAMKNLFTDIDARYLLTYDKGTIMSETYTKGFPILNL